MSGLSNVPGSSPHVRGALVDGACLATVCGIIPACAGSTPSRCRRIILWRDHPRMCGEHAGCCITDHRSRGSSPHVRGALGALPLFGVWPGIIPACAGSTTLQRAFTSENGDHPRMCGEHLVFACPIANDWGSSPHVRGALPKRVMADDFLGIIPACAGSTDSHILLQRG